MLWPQRMLLPLVGLLVACGPPAAQAPRILPPCRPQRTPPKPSPLKPSKSASSVPATATSTEPKIPSPASPAAAAAKTSVLPPETPQIAAATSAKPVGTVPPRPVDRQLEVQRALLKLPSAALIAQARKDFSAMGSLSIGAAAGGALLGGVQLKNGRLMKVVSGHGGWGTRETIHYLKLALHEVYQRFPNTPPLPIGHISARRGGPLAPHKSHQSGRDVDVSYFYRGKPRWYHRATSKNLDRARSWALVKALIVHSDVHYIFINSSIQKLLKEHALATGENKEWLDSIFQYKSKSPNPIVRHVRGHDTHLHVRFYNPIAQELARRLHPLLVERKLIRKATRYRSYRARKGDLLSRIARRFGTSVKAIMKANGLRNSRIRAGKRYRIPQKQKGQVRRPPPLHVPKRRLPPPTGSTP
jgi:murein endopeptidase